MNNLSFNGITKPYITVLEKKRPVFAPIRRNFLTIPGMPGAYLESTDTEVREQSVTIMVDSSWFDSLQKLKEDMGTWLFTENVAPLIFEDENDRIYYAVVEGSINLEEIATIGQGSITFVCPDPYKYGPEQSDNITDLLTPAVIQNGGSVDTPPTFDITLKSLTTYLDIVGDEHYMRIGQPTTVDQVAYKKFEEQFGSDGTSLVGWGDAGFTLDDGAVRTGTMVSSSGDFIASDYGTGTGWHGPAKQSGIGTALNDYVVRAYFDTALINNQRGRTEVYLLDDTNRIIGKVAAVVRRPTGVDVDIYIQNGTKRHVFITQKWKYKDFFGYLDIIKEGNVFTASVAQQGVNEQGKIYTRAKDTFTFNDLNNEFQVPLSAVGMHIGAYGAPFPTKARIRGMEILKINQQSGVEYIGDTGDIFTFDHKNSRILRNGEVFTRKDFGARFFNLKSGSNVLVMNPPEVIEKVDVRWRERFR